LAGEGPVVTVDAFSHALARVERATSRARLNLGYGEEAVAASASRMKATADMD
jgi:hypothetical protein